jgi:hypothetical protein
VIRAIEFDAPHAWLRDPSKLEPLVVGFDQSGLRPDSLSARPVVGKAVELCSWAAVAEWLRQNDTDVYQIEPGKTEPRFNLRLNLTDVSLGVECEMPVDHGSIGVERGILGRLLEALHNGYCRHARVGPILAITLRHVDYDRPRPLHNDPQFPAGSVTLGVCQRFSESRGAEGRRRFETLRSRPLPSGLVRHQSGDLVVLETEATGGAELSRQRSLLEKWIGESLKLSLDEDFDERGDKRVMVWQREKAGEFGFYDAATSTLYKSAPELKNDDLDLGTLRLLERTLGLAALPDGREIRAKRVVFVRRPAALRWLPWVSERGGFVAYLGEDGELWEPAPDGPSLPWRGKQRG